jgi:hypothetical protein
MIQIQKVIPNFLSNVSSINTSRITKSLFDWSCRHVQILSPAKHEQAIAYISLKRKGVKMETETNVKENVAAR